MLQGKTALVTGASRGIGYELSLKLAEQGAHIIAVSRTQSGLEKLDDAIKAKGGSATLVPLDLKDLPALDRLGAVIDERFKKLDIFVGNGAILGPISPINHIEPKMWDDVMATNVTANLRLLQACHNALHASENARVVFMSSGASWKGTAYWGAYATSKAALDAIARAYAAETAESNLRINLFNPGPIRTKMRAQAMPGEDPMTLDTPEQAATQLAKLCLPSCKHHGEVYDYPSKSFKKFQHPL
jgi:NAD(P)-dependent dehydrogenase (short-subunit alcohol dehydrogenase family)